MSGKGGVGLMRINDSGMVSAAPSYVLPRTVTKSGPNVEIGGSITAAAASNPGR